MHRCNVVSITGWHLEIVKISTELLKEKSGIPNHGASAAVSYITGTLLLLSFFRVGCKIVYYTVQSTVILVETAS